MNYNMHIHFVFTSLFQNNHFLIMTVYKKVRSKKGVQEFRRRFVLAPQVRLLTMLWSFEKGTILTPLSKNLALQKHMSIAGLMRRLSLIGIDAICQLSLGCCL